MVSDWIIGRVGVGASAIDCAWSAMRLIAIVWKCYLCDQHVVVGWALQQLQFSEAKKVRKRTSGTISIFLQTGSALRLLCLCTDTSTRSINTRTTLTHQNRTLYTSFLFRFPEWHWFCCLHKIQTFEHIFYHRIPLYSDFVRSLFALVIPSHRTAAAVRVCAIHFITFSICVM